jgi:hypothetical protein
MELDLFSLQVTPIYSVVDQPHREAKRDMEAIPLFMPSRENCRLLSSSFHSCPYGLELKTFTGFIPPTLTPFDNALCKTRSGNENDVQ